MEAMGRAAIAVSDWVMMVTTVANADAIIVHDVNNRRKPPTRMR